MSSQGPPVCLFDISTMMSWTAAHSGAAALGESRTSFFRPLLGDRSLRKACSCEKAAADTLNFEAAPAKHFPAHWE